MFETAYEYYLGIDVGKMSHRACAIDGGGNVLFNIEVKNTDAELHAALKRISKDSLVVVDQKRNIATLPIRCARKEGLEVAYLSGNAMKKASDLFPGMAKTDKREAEVIAQAARAIPSLLLPLAKEDSQSEMLRRLAAQNASLVAERTRLINRLHAVLLESNAAFEALADLNSGWTLKLLACLGGPWNIFQGGRRRFKAWMEKTPYADNETCEKLWGSLKAASPVTEGQIKAEAHTVRSIARRIMDINEETTCLTKIIDSEMCKSVAYQALLTIPGIGVKTASELVLAIDISNFKDHHALASYAGLAPRNRQSGTSLNSVRSTKMGNKRLKNLLIFSCSCLIGSDTYYGHYYGELRKRGKRHTTALKAVARKRLKAIYVIMRDGTTYVE